MTKRLADQERRRKATIAESYARAELAIEKERIARTVEAGVAANRELTERMLAIWRELAVPALARASIVAPRTPVSDRPLWQAATDGMGGVFGVLGSTQLPRTELPSFESTLAADVDRLWVALGGPASAPMSTPRVDPSVRHGGTS